MLLTSVQSELLMVGLHTGQVKVLSSATRPVFSLDYHWQQQRVYWLSADYQSIRWTHLSDTSKKGTLVKGMDSCWDGHPAVGHAFNLSFNIFIGQHSFHHRPRMKTGRLLSQL